MRRGLGRLLVFAAVALLPAVLYAAADFEFTTYDYAGEAWWWEGARLQTRIENTGSEADTIDLEITNADLPPGWYAALCINGRCFGMTAPIVLGPGQSDTVDIDVFVGDSVAVGTLDLRGVMRNYPAVVRTETGYAVFCGQSALLMVDDDGGAAYESYMEDAIADAGYAVHVWDADNLGRPDDVRLSSYWSVLWTTADGSAGYITAGDEEDMMTYLDNGGNLLFASMGFLSSRGGATTFTSDYLHLNGWTDDSGGTDITGASGDPIGDGMSFDLSGGPFSPAGSDLMAYVFPALETFYAGAGTRGISVKESGHKLVFLSFPFENIPVAGPDPDNQAEVLRRALLWFEPQMSADDDIAEMGVDIGGMHNSPNPFGTETRITYNVKKGGSVRLSVYTPTGRFVTDLVDRYIEPGTHLATWDGRDSMGRDMGSGIYYYRLVTGNTYSTGKMILLR
jgi:hypothetical protein